MERGQRYSSATSAAASVLLALVAGCGTCGRAQPAPESAMVFVRPPPQSGLSPFYVSRDVVAINAPHRENRDNTAPLLFPDAGSARTFAGQFGLRLPTAAEYCYLIETGLRGTSHRDGLDLRWHETNCPFESITGHKNDGNGVRGILGGVPEWCQDAEGHTAAFCRNGCWAVSKYASATRRDPRAGIRFVIDAESPR